MGLLAAIQFLTRIPVRLRREPSLAGAAPWFPLAGVLIGAAVGGIGAGLWHVVPPLVAAAVAVALGVLITGAFHEDGLADVADAFGGGWTVERRLEILKDPRHGSYGVAAMCASIVIRVVCLGSMPGPGVLLGSAIAAHAVGRAAVVALMATQPIATADGLGAGYARGLSRPTAWLGIAAGIGLSAIAIGWWIGPVVATALVGAAAVAWLAHRKIGGITGDVLGACEQVVECLALVVLTGLATHHQLWWR